MKNYKITVNGTQYDVVVEETTSAGAAPAEPIVEVAPKVAETSAASGVQGGVAIKAPMPGKVLAVKVSAGQAVKRGTLILLLEAMKMENEIVAPQDGIIASINVSEGGTVDAGNVLATMN